MKKVKLLMSNKRYFISFLLKEIFVSMGTSL